jgi:hypothetical protein
LTPQGAILSIPDSWHPSTFFLRRKTASFKFKEFYKEAAPPITIFGFADITVYRIEKNAFDHMFSYRLSNAV